VSDGNGTSSASVSGARFHGRASPPARTSDGAEIEPDVHQTKSVAPDSANGSPDEAEKHHDQNARFE
jgi:hypothetical protein